MPNCVLRVSGPTAKVKKFLELTSLKPAKVYLAGTPHIIKSRGLNKRSGFNIDVCKSNDGLMLTQTRHALYYLRKHEKDLKLLTKLQFKNMVLDFGLYDQADDSKLWPMYRVPALLVAMLGKYSIEIELSFYGQP